MAKKANQKPVAKKKSAKKKAAPATARGQATTERQWSILGTCEAIDTDGQKTMDVRFVPPGEVGSGSLNFQLFGTCFGIVGTQRTMKVNFKRRMVQGKPRFTLTLDE